MMASTTTDTPKQTNELATYLSVLTSPGAAFDQLRDRPTWLWGVVFGIVLAIIGAFLAQPATVHVTELFQQQIVAHAAADQQAAIRERFASQNLSAPWKPVVNATFGTAVSFLFVALVALLGGAIGGSGSFKKAWALAVNGGLPGILGILVNDLILMLRGPDSASSFSDLFAVPSLGMLAPQNPALAAFLSNVSPFQVWYYYVLMIGTERVLGVKRTIAIAVSVAVFLLSGLVFAGFAALGAMATGK